jgi:hypothetical protein
MLHLIAHLWTTAPYGVLPAFVVEKSCAIACCSKVRVQSAAFFGSNHLMPQLWAEPFTTSAGPTPSTS